MQRRLNVYTIRLARYSSAADDGDDYDGDAMMSIYGRVPDGNLNMNILRAWLRAFSTRSQKIDCVCVCGRRLCVFSIIIISQVLVYIVRMLPQKMCPGIKMFIHQKWYHTITKNTKYTKM